jgi:tetratricopeptide (TPR) repeat protein
MFYGVCFDYAEAAYNDILQYQSHYESLGMAPNGWFMVGTYNDPNLISLCDPVPREQSNRILNGVPVNEHTSYKVQAHNNATMHEWLWVYGVDGTIYWIDPTWTDNTGYVWWGVVQDGKEVQWKPAAEFCKVTQNPNNEVFDYLNRGNGYLNKEMYDQAIADFNQAIRIDPNNASAYINRGVAYSGKGDYDRAIADYTQAIRLDSNSANAYEKRGWAYANKGDYDRAIADFTQAIRLNPNFGVYNNRGLIYADMGDYNRAIADYNQAISLNPDVHIYYNRGSLYSEKGDYDRAISDFTQAIKIDPNFAAAYTDRGYLYRQKGDSNRAITDYTQAIRLDPYYVDGYICRGETYGDKGDYDKAIADFTQALRLDPNNANAKAYLERAQRAWEIINSGSQQSAPPSNNNSENYYYDPSWLGISFQFGLKGDSSGDIGLYWIKEIFGFSLNYCWSDTETDWTFLAMIGDPLSDTKTDWAIMASGMIGYPLADWFSPYFEAGIGYGSSFAWKVGARAGFHINLLDLDVFYSYNNIFGHGIGIGIGWGM